MEDDGDDPFHSLVPLCHVSSSQEELLRRCPFAPEPYNPGNDTSSPSSSAEADGGGGGIRIASTPIRLVSLTESEEEKNTAENPSRDDEFLTPPEEAAVSSSGEFRPAADVFGHDSGVESLADVHVADLSRDSDIEFSKVEAVQRENPDSGRLVSQRQNPDPEVNRLSSELEAVRIENESELEMTQRENLDPGSEVLTRELSFKAGLGGPPSKKPKVSDQNGKPETGGDERLSARDFVEAMNTSSLSEEAAAAAETRRLPESILGRPEKPPEDGGDGNGRDEVTLFDVLKILAGGCEDDGLSCSFLEICRRRQVSFPSPAWWPQGGTGFGDD